MEPMGSDYLQILYLYQATFCITYVERWRNQIFVNLYAGDKKTEVLIFPLASVTLCKSRHSQGLGFFPPVKWANILHCTILDKA